jgi:hypothetical protein
MSDRIEAAGALALELSRRQVLGLVATGAAAMLVRPPSVRAALASSPAHGFLTSDELAILDAATAHIVPTDSHPGARECGVVDYIQSMLSFMPGSDANCDRRVNAADVTGTAAILGGHSSACRHGGDVDGNGVVDAGDVVAAEAAVFQARPVDAGGPFSGRQPQEHFSTGTMPCYVCHSAPAPHAAGAAAVAGRAQSTVNNYPPDFFTEFLPLSRLRLLSWNIRILGTAAVPEAAANPLATELLETDQRLKYRDGLAQLEAISQGEPTRSRFIDLTPSQRTTVMNKANADFILLLTYHTVEGMLCAPEYGGNRNRVGWQLVSFDGDSQPLGYTIYDETVPGHYRERPDKPNSLPNPDEDCLGFSKGVNSFLTVIARAEFTQPGKRFPNPYCFGVPA